MENFTKFYMSVDTTDYTLIIPSVSVGNVGQLTVDLLIHTHDFERFGTIWDPAIIPVVSGDPFTGCSDDVCTACELYVNRKLKTVVMQLRSSIEVQLALKFFRKLKTKLLAMKFKEIIILASMHSYEIHKVASSHYRFCTNSPSFEERFKQANVPAMETNQNGSFVVYGAGLACRLYEKLTDTFNVAVLFKYTSEGDNRPDALQTLQVLYKVVELCKGLNVPVKYPESWQYVFGNPPPAEMY